MGQALALGAVGLLHKPVDPAELAALLARVDRLRGAPTAEVTSRAAITGVIDVPEALRTAAPRTGGPPVPLPVAGTAAGRPRRRGRWGIAALALLWLLPAGWVYQRVQQSERLVQTLNEENARLQAEQQAARERVTSEPEPGSARPAANRALLDTLAWAINQHGQYGLHEEPLNDTRLAQVRELVARLGAAGFEGTLRLETHIAEFCLSRDEQGNLRMPSDVTPFLRCEVVSYPPAQAQMLGNRQSPAFARFLATPRSGPIQIAVVSHGASRPLVSYPDRASVQTAGDWNQIARLNQRVEIVLQPAPPP
jgi:hypothetical protein